MSKTHQVETYGMDGIPVRAVRKRKKRFNVPYNVAKMTINTAAPHISSQKQYFKWRKENKAWFMPSRPDRYYKNFEWSDFLLVYDPYASIRNMIKMSNRRPKVYRPLWEAIKWAQYYCKQNNITTQDQWHKHFKANTMPDDIPNYPENAYGKDFPGYKVWFGKKLTAFLDAQEEITSILTLCHVSGEPVNVVGLRLWRDGVSDLRDNWEKQSEYDRILAKWQYERDLMPKIDEILAKFASPRETYHVVPNLNALLWELNNILLIVR